ncbi:thiaminase II [Klebsiella quasipneumoniae]|nr:thiaminase II [Klebsiella quasipneumoniae]
MEALSASLLRERPPAWQAMQLHRIVTNIGPSAANSLFTPDLS